VAERRGSGGGAGGRLEPGDVAPPFALEDEDGRMVSLADFAGRRVVVYFYPKDDTPGCTKEACQFSDLLEDFERLGVDVLGISPDTPASHRRFRAKHGLRVRLLSDPSHEVMSRYGAYGEKTLYGRTTLGVIRSTVIVGADGRVERAWYGVRADGHAGKVLEALSPAGG
jgi:peroxiredoxin Q/BCP